VRKQNALAGQIQFLNIVKVNAPGGFVVRELAHGFVHLSKQFSWINRGTIDFPEVRVTLLRKTMNQPGIGILACPTLSENQDGDICPGDLSGHGVKGDHGWPKSVDKPSRRRIFSNERWDLVHDQVAAPQAKADESLNDFLTVRVQVRFQKGKKTTY
jgi:hypothetical protein